MSRRRVRGLLAQGGGRLEPREGQEPEHDPQEQRRRSSSRPAALNTLSVKPACPPRGVAGQQRGPARSRSTIRISATVAPSTVSSTFVPRRAGKMATTRVSASATPASRNGAHDGGCVPDADDVQEVGAEDARGRGRHHGVERVRAEQAPARRPRPRGARASRRRRRRPTRSGGSTGTAGRTSYDTSRTPTAAMQEGQRHRPADGGRAGLRVDVRGHAGRHQRDGQPDGLPHRQRPPQAATW